MRVPKRLLHQIILFVSDHYHSAGLIASPSDMGVACGHEAEAWIDLAPHRVELNGLDRTELISCCERLGKSLGSFFLNEREVQ